MQSLFVSHCIDCFESKEEKRAGPLGDGGRDDLDVDGEIISEIVNKIKSIIDFESKE